MSEWATKTIGELCDKGSGEVKTGPFGSQLHQSDYSNEGVPVVMPADIGEAGISEERIARVSVAHVDRLAKHKLGVGDIVYGRRGDIGRQALILPNQAGWLCGTGCLRITLGNSEVIPEYLHLYLKMSDVIEWIQNQAIGATMPNLNTQILRRVPVRFPKSKKVQERIASIVFSYDGLIQNTKRRIALLEKMAEEIYREWFVRFRFPGWRNAKFVKGVPEGWKLKKLPHVANITYGFPFQSSRFNAEGIGKPIIRIRNIPDSSTSDFADEIVDDKYLVKTGDFIVGMDGEFHMNHWYGEEAYLVQRVCKIIAKDSSYKGYLARALRAPIKHYESILMGATVGHLGAKHLNAIEILIPPDSLKERLSILNDIESQKANLSLLNVELMKTKNKLLPRLISGKLSVENLNIQFPPSMKKHFEAEEKVAA